jgi:hypothetical protein
VCLDLYERPVTLAWYASLLLHHHHPHHEAGNYEKFRSNCQV